MAIEDYGSVVSVDFSKYVCPSQQVCSLGEQSPTNRDGRLVVEFSNLENRQLLRSGFYFKGEVYPVIDLKEQDHLPDQDHLYKIRVHNIPSSTDNLKRRLKSMFGPFGEVRSVKVPKNCRRNYYDFKSRGLSALITFYSMETVRAILKPANYFSIAGTPVYCEPLREPRLSKSRGDSENYDILSSSDSSRRFLGDKPQRVQEAKPRNKVSSPGTGRSNNFGYEMTDYFDSPQFDGPSNPNIINRQTRGQDESKYKIIKTISIHPRNQNITDFVNYPYRDFQELRQTLGIGNGLEPSERQIPKRKKEIKYKYGPVESIPGYSHYEEEYDYFSENVTGLDPSLLNAAHDPRDRRLNKVVRQVEVKTILDIEDMFQGEGPIDRYLDIDESSSSSSLGE